MPRYKDEPPAVRVYTVCDESRYLIVRNVPALGCGDELLKLFATYGDVEDCKPMDAEDCEPYTDVYWVKFRLVSNARFAKRKLDEFVFLGNRLQVSYAPQFESVLDTKEKLETRRKEVLARVNSSAATKQVGPSKSFSNASQETILGSEWNSSQPEFIHHLRNNPLQRVSTQQDYFASPSMNQTVCLVREKLNKVRKTTELLQQNHPWKTVATQSARTFLQCPPSLESNSRRESLPVLEILLPPKALEKGEARITFSVLIPHLHQPVKETSKKIRTVYNNGHAVRPLLLSVTLIK